MKKYLLIGLWHIIKCGKEAVPCLISMLEDSSLVNVVYERRFPFSEKKEYEVSVARIAYSLLLQIFKPIYSTYLIILFKIERGIQESLDGTFYLSTVQ